MPTYAYSAEMSHIKSEHFDRLVIQGNIERGDYQKFLDLITKAGYIPEYLNLSSSGGSVSEALKIGRFARRALMLSMADTCDSACVFIVMGGVGSVVNPWGEFGLHRPGFGKGHFATLTAEQALQSYERMRKAVVVYMGDMGVPANFIERIFSISPASLEFISQPDFFDIVGRSPAGYEEWLIAKCGSATESFSEFVCKTEAIKEEREIVFGTI